MRPTDSRPRARRCYARAVLSSPTPLLLLRLPTTSHPILKSHSISPDPPQAGHAPVPPHLSQSPSYPDSTAAPTSTPVPPHALHLPPPPHSVQGFDRAVITHPLGLEAEPLAGQLSPQPHTPHASTRSPQSGLMVTSARAPFPLDRPAAPSRLAGLKKKSNRAFLISITQPEPPNSLIRPKGGSAVTGRFGACE
jgi:hypothetical protein